MRQVAASFDQTGFAQVRVSSPLGGDARSAWRRQMWPVMAFGLKVVPLGIVSLILEVLQGVFVGPGCFLCMVTVTLSAGLAILALHEIGACFLLLWLTRRRNHGHHCFWSAVGGRASHDADPEFEPPLHSNAT